MDRHVDRELICRTEHIDGRGREGIHFGLVGIYHKLLLRFDHFGDAADGVKLNVIQGKVVTDIERVGIQVNHGDGDVVTILISVESLGMLMPAIVTELGFAEIERLGVPCMSVVLNAEDEACGVVHFTIVVDVCRPEREHVGGTFLQFEFGVGGRCGIPCFLITSFDTGLGIE